MLLIIFSIAILAGIIYYLYVNASDYFHLLQFSIPGIIALLILSLAIPVVNGLISVYTFQSLGVHLSFREGFYLAASATLANQLPLPGGIVARGVYLKHKHRLSYTQYFSATLALFFCSIAINGLIGVLVLLYGIISNSFDVSYYLLVGFSAMTACILVFFLPLNRLPLPENIQYRISQALVGWEVVSTNFSLLAKILGLQIGFMLLFALRQWVAFRMLSQILTLDQVILLSAGSILTQLVSFAPGGLGVRETIVGGIASILGFDLTVSIAAVEVDRVVSTMVIFVVGGISSIILGRQITNSKIEINDNEM
jgi:uncharacterized membrane protein YbhN (UPF0104 family)